MSGQYIQSLKEVFAIIVDYIFQYYKNGNEKFLIPAIICVLYMLIFEKDVRKKYIIPLIVMVLIILNPISYDKVFSNTYMYWRLFWVFSLHIIFATTFICISKRLNNDILKIVLLALASFAIINFGQESIFEGEVYSETQSLEKLPEDVVKVAEYMLSLEKKPYVIGDDELNLYVRQYSGKIKQLWGRNKEGLISEFDGEAEMVYEKMRIGDYDFLFNFALNNGYQFVVTHHRFYPEEIANQYGYEIIENIGEFHIYYLTGNVKEVSNGD